MKMTWLIAAFTLLVAFPPPAAAGDGYEKADAVYLDVRDEYTLLEDGSTVHRHAHKVRLLTHYAFHRLLGESFIVYNPRFQELKIHRSVTTMADGKEVASTPNAFNEVLPGFCRNAAPYLHLREMVVTHLGLEVDAVIHLDYEIRSQPEFVPFLMGEEVFAGHFPVEKKHVIVKVPEGVELKHQFLHHEPFTPEVASEGGYKTYTWTFANLPMAPPEALAQPLADYAPLLVFSTCPAWADAAGHLNQHIATAAWMDEACERKVRELKEKANGPLDLVLRINRFVAEEVGAAAVNPRYVGYRIQKCKEVFHYNVGTTLDKTMLLTAMIRGAGYFAEPVLVSRHRTVAEGVPSCRQFADCRVLCTLRRGLDEPLFLDKPVYLDPLRVVPGFAEDALEGRTIFRPSLLNNHLFPVEPSQEQRNRVKADLALTLSDKHRMSGEVQLEVTGTLNPYVKLLNDFKAWASGGFRKLVTGAELSEVKPVLQGENRSVFKGKIKSSKPLAETGGLLYYTVPGCPGGLSDLGAPAALPERVTPLWLPRAFSEELNLSIRLPESVVVLSLPAPVEINNAAGKLVCGAWVEEGVLHVQRMLSMKQCILPGEYEAYRKLAMEWNAEDARRIVLKSN